MDVNPSFSHFLCMTRKNVLAMINEKCQIDGRNHSPPSKMLYEAMPYVSDLDLKLGCVTAEFERLKGYFS